MRTRLSLCVALAIAGAALYPARVHAEAEGELHEGDKLFEEGDWKKAAGAYDRAIAKAPSEVSAEAYGKRTAIFIIQKDYKGGLDFVAKAKGRYPNAAEVLEQEAVLLWETDGKSEAIAIAEKVVKTRPQAFTNPKIIGEYYSSRDPVKTAAAFEAYISHRPAELEPGDVLPRVQLGFAYLTNARAVLGDGDEVHAEQLYTKAVDQFEYVSRKLGKRPNAQINADNGLCAAYTGLRRWGQAVTVCERIVHAPKQIDTTGSVWFNLATAYLANKQTKKARSAATEFMRIRKGEPRGLMLVGDTFFADGEWSNALVQYTRAEKLLKPNQSRDQVQLSIRLGKTYRRLPAPATGENPNLKLAVGKLSSAWNSNPSSLELATELGAAYLESKQDANATALTEKVLAGPDLAKAPANQRAALLVMAGKALFNEHKLKDARQRFEAAQQLKPADITIRREVITTINEQAFETKDGKAAQALLDQALALDGASTTTLANVAVLAIERNDCELALKQLARLADVRGSDAVLTRSLIARAYLCGRNPNLKKALEAYAAAEQAAKQANAQLALAEIYSEWAPLVWDTDLGAAIDKLELAAAAAAQDPEVAPVAKRNLALALFRRGSKALQDGKAGEAAADFERATRDPSVLRGGEPLAFDFSLAVALVEAGRAADAAKLFKQLATHGNPSAYLTSRYAKVGAQLWPAYAGYRTASGAARATACGELAKLEPELGPKARELVASCWELVAIDEWRNGSTGAAQRALATAAQTATADQKRRLTLNRAALALDKGKLGELEALGGNPPEALVDLGIVYEMLGKPAEAFEAWQKAKARGVTARELQKWIDAKKKIYGF